MKFEKNTLSEKWKREFEVMLIDLEKNSGKGLMEGGPDFRTIVYYKKTQLAEKAD